MSIKALALPVDEATQVPGWDQTIDENSSTTTSDSPIHVSIAMHAMAHETLVCGISDNDWIQWKTSLSPPHRVCQVASTSDGTLVAATLANGTVSILKGADGTVLATRRVAREGLRLSAQVFFVANGSHQHTLVILPPDDGPPLLVSNMQGDRLNSVENPGMVAEAARSMVVHALQLEGCSDVRAIQGHAMQDKIRFAVVDGDGLLAIYDYHLVDKQSTLIQRNVALQSENWEIDLEVALQVQTVGADHAFLVLSMYSGSKTKLCWVNLNTLTVAGEYLLQSGGVKRARLLDLKPVTSCSPADSLALVVTIKAFADAQHTTQTRVIQAAMETLTLKAHTLYTIPVPSAVKSMSIAPLTGENPYSFRCKTWSVGTHTCHEFRTEDTSVGSIRLMVASNKFEEAMTLTSTANLKALTADQFARFHPAEVAQSRLEHILAAGSVSTVETMQHSQECVHQLVLGAHSDSTYGKQAFLGAATKILEWPDQTALKNAPSVAEVEKVLNGFLVAMTSVAGVFPQSEEFQNRMEALQERRAAMTYLISILQEKKTVPLNEEFAKVYSLKELFAALVKNNLFLAAEQMWRSDKRSKLTVDVMVSSLLGIKPVIRPHLYCSLLKEIIFPSLSINHELLPALLSWACKTADAYDDEKAKQLGLDDSIFLLQIVERATKDLRLKVHESFSKSTPFVERSGTKRRVVISNDTDSSFSSTSSVERTSVQKNVGPDQAQPNPTILEWGRLKGGAQKARLGRMKAIRVDAVDEREENVESKLGSAKCLKLARSLGLPERLVSLRTFDNCGGSQHIAKELVRLFSTSAKSHDDRVDRLSGQVFQFCEESGANFDMALREYAKDLCGGKHTSKQAIEEASSVARCGKMASTKCQVTLVALRAALFCRFSPSWLTKLSQEAIEWASGDSSLRSELEEASRLLLIDGIVGRYCGEGAKELFHVDNPRHAIRLLEFVSLHFENDHVMSDTLDLCDAFAHLSQEDACSRILQNTVIHGKSEVCTSLLDSLYQRNVSLAKATFSRSMTFCLDMLEEVSLKFSATPTCAAEEMHRISQLTLCASALCKAALGRIHSDAGRNNGYSCIAFDESRLEELWEDLKRLETLQKDHSIVIPLSSLQSPKTLVETVVSMLDPLVESYVAGEPKTSSVVATQTKRVCSVLAGPTICETDLWFTAVGSSACHLAARTEGRECINLLSDLGILDAEESSLATRSCLAVGLSLCLKASKLAEKTDPRPAMKQVIMALSLLQDYTLSRCPPAFLGDSVGLTELCDIVAHVLVRADEGLGEELQAFRKHLHIASAGERYSSGTTQELAKFQDSPRLASPPALHETWYVGDGLLLPPRDTLVHGLRFCRQVLREPGRSDAALALHSFLGGRGSHSASLRLLAFAGSVQMCTTVELPLADDFTEANSQNIVSLAERYLGGTGNGITSGTVDSQMALSFLLALPLKVAFKVYKSSLPTAMTTRDFSRVVVLASVGKAAGRGDLFVGPNTKALRHWRRQSKFVAQCDELALRATWWKVLQDHHVKFDPHRFEGERKAGKPTVSSQYVSSLITPLVSSLSRIEANPEVVFKTAMDFACAFGVGRNAAVQAYLGYLLSPPESLSSDGQASSRVEDIRLKLSSLESVVKTLLRQLECTRDRAKVLRRCVMRLESTEHACDYERLSVVLSLYQVELDALLAAKNEKTKSVAMDLELVDRRRDALAILASFFQGYNRSERPPISSFFLPLPDFSEGDVLQRALQQKKLLLVGKEGTDEVGSLDPLEKLEEVLALSPSSTAALAPLCLPLGVPRGYIHARSLVGRFRKAKSDDASLPCFETDVSPVLNRLKSPEDAADLAVWCSSKYSYDEEDRLRCLDKALDFATKASSDAEMLLSRKGHATNDAQEHLSNALERVKRITSSKDILADRLAINSILRSGATGIDQKSCVVTTIVDKVMVRLEQDVWSKETFHPERFVETILRESSILAAESSLGGEEALSVGQFGLLSRLVHKACEAVADKYSHVHIGHVARKLAKTWLFHGDEVTSDEDSKLPSPRVGTVTQKAVDTSILPDLDEDDTIDFVMDLNNLEEVDKTWAVDVGSGPTEETSRRLTSEEEPSSLASPGSTRERSEFRSRRAALRISFVVAHATGYHAQTPALNSTDGDENVVPKTNERPKSKGLLSKLSSRAGKQQTDIVLEHSKELLRIVFAKSGASDLIVRDLNTSIDSRSVVGTGGGLNTTITFAMRHRALRASSILCPQDALEDVVQKEELVAASCSLKRSAFGAFVAKEIEEMGLPLPHSDLAQLSTMHYPSYARTLWRHHRDSNGSKGRLLLLILEMYLKETISDGDFLVSVLNEMDGLNLPRTLLMGLECLVEYVRTREPPGLPERVLPVLHRSVAGLVGRVFAEWNTASTTNDNAEHEAGQGLSTVQRLGVVIQSFSEAAEGQTNLVDFVDRMLNLTRRCEQDKTHVASVLRGCLRRVSSRATAIRLCEGGKHILSPDEVIAPNSLVSSSREESGLSHALYQVESTLLKLPSPATS